MNGLHDVVRDVICELDADGGGFVTREAADLILFRVVEAGVVNEAGEVSKLARQLMRKGAAQAVAEYRPELLIAAAATAQQGDLADIDEGFNHWVQDWSALDESHGAVRKKLVRMTLHEIRMVIALKRKKASEATEIAHRLQRVIDMNPSWTDHPMLTLGDILSIAPDAA